MAKYINPAGQDAQLAYVTASNIMHFCSGQPANYAGIAAVSLGSVVPTFTGPSAGSPNGRQTSVDAKTGVAVTNTGTVTHMALASTGDSTLRYVTTTTSQAVTSGGTMSETAWVINAADPT